jgi:electron transfer flavoprotein alpha subunit
VLVTIGKGACRAEHVPMFQELADMLGGTIACSRPVVEAGLMSYARQVGQTGKTVAPKIYIGIGVSGSMQHMAGIQGAETIVAINSDPAAPIVQAADYSLIGDYREIVPALISRLKNKVANLAGSKP